MRAWGFSLLALAGLVIILWASQDAEATSSCQPTVPTANVCHAFSHVSTKTGGDGTNAICFTLRTTNTNPPCTTSGITGAVNEATWELDAGACITLRYFRGQSNALLSPPPPNKVTIRVFYDSTASITRTFLNAGAEPASGTTYSFCATNDGTSGGTPRAGQYYIDIRAVKDNSGGGLQDYNIQTNGAATVGALCSATCYDSGVIRARAFVSDITRSAYPSGSMFAYGPAGDETMTITGTFTQPGGDANTETMRTFITDDATLALGQVGATVDVDSGSLAQGFVADNTFGTTSFTAAAGLTIIGNGFSGEKWTVLAASGHGSSLTRLSDTSIRITATFAIHAGIRADSDCSGTYAAADNMAIIKLGSSTGPVVDRFNKGEVGYAELCIFNARDQKLTRSMTIAREDAAPTTCASALSTPSGVGLYSGTFTLATGVVCLASGDPGSARYYRITNTDQNYRTDQIFTVSPVLKPEAQPQLTGTLGAETLVYSVRDNGLGGDASDHIRPFCHVNNVRDENLDTSGSAVAWTIKDPTTATRASGTGDTGSDGWTPALGDFLASTPLGTTWSQSCTATFNGNTGTDTDQFTIELEAVDPGETVYTGVDPMTVNVAWKEGYLNQTNLVSITARFLDGTARLDAEDEILVDIYDPANALLVTGASPVEVGGGIYRYTFAGDDVAGDYLVVARNTDPPTMGGASSNAFTVLNATGNETVADIIAALNDHRGNSMEILGMSFNNLEFDGFLITVAWFAMLLYCLVKFRVFAGFAATLGLLESVIPDVMPGSFLGYFLLLALAVWLEAIAGERIYSRWLNKPNKDRDNS